MSLSRLKIVTFFTAAFLSIWVHKALPGGFMIPQQTARAVGLSNAMTAGVADPSAVYYNPAALSEVDGNQLMLNGAYVNVISSVKNGGRSAVNKHDDNYFATLFANYHIPGSDFTVGIGSYVPFGFATNYDRDFTRFAAQKTELRTLYVTPAVSWHPSKHFSLGAGFSFVHASGLFSRSLCFDPFFGCVFPGGEEKIRITDTANAFTYNLGFLLKPNEAVKIGLSYRARADLRFDTGNVKLGGDFGPGFTRANIRPIPLPPVINLGLFWQINPSWGVEFVYEHTRWSEFKALSAVFSPAPFGITSFSLPQEWKNTSAIRIGSFYKINPTFELRGGIVLEETPIPSRRLNPSIPGADLFALTAGIGYKQSGWTIDLGYMAVFYKSREVTNLELEGVPAPGFPFAGAPGKDKYEIFNNFVSLSLNYQF